MKSSETFFTEITNSVTLYHKGRCFGTVPEDYAGKKEYFQWIINEWNFRKDEIKFVNKDGWIEIVLSKDIIREKPVDNVTEM